MRANIYVLGGNGNVGSEFVRQVVNKDLDKLRIIGLASIEGYIYNPKGIKKEDALKFTKNEIPIKEHPGLDELLNEVINDFSEEEIIFVDITAGKGLFLELHKRIIKETNFKIVTANKNPLSFCNFETFNFLTHDLRRYGYRVTVMAGAESIYFLRDLRELKEDVYEIQGCFSGTLGYITSELEKGRKLSEVVKEAKMKGYSEPHPRDDLNGLDVARKLLILARTLGMKVDLDDIIIEPFIPYEYLQEEDDSSFLNNLRELNGVFEEKFQDAMKKGNVLRYIASYKNNKFEVSLREIPKESPLGILKGTRNKFVVYSESYNKENYYCVEAPGAGPRIAAMNLRRDIINILNL